MKLKMATSSRRPFFSMETGGQGLWLRLLARELTGTLERHTGTSDQEQHQRSGETTGPAGRPWTSNPLPAPQGLEAPPSTGCPLGPRNG